MCDISRKHNHKLPPFSVLLHLYCITCHIIIEIIHGSHNVLCVLTWVGRILAFFTNGSSIMASMNYVLNRRVSKLTERNCASRTRKFKCLKNQYKRFIKTGTKCLKIICIAFIFMDMYKLKVCTI